MLLLDILGLLADLNGRRWEDSVITWDEIFEAYYNIYRAEATTPASTDDEYTVALRLANEAVNYWAHFDGTYWRELFNTLQNADDGTKTLATSTTTYDAPSDFAEIGGYVKYLDSSNNIVSRVPIIEPHQAQFKDQKASYTYFTGDPGNGYILNVNPAPASADNGRGIDYIYYRTPLEITTGSDVPEMSNPYFMVHRMLAMRFRNSRNPYYSTALRDSENTIRLMKIDNDSGNWSNPWSVPDNSGSSWGQ